MNTYELLFVLLRSLLRNQEPELTLDHPLEEQPLHELYALAKAHDMAHLIGTALMEHRLLPEQSEVIQKFQKQQMIAIYRYEQLQYALDEIGQVLEEAAIEHVPLKGSVLRQYYSEPWMRTSCDIDLLVHESDLTRATEVLSEKLQYRAVSQRNYHDISLYAPSGVHLELHFSIKENMENIDCLLEHVWDHTVPVSRHSYQRVETNEYFLFHHIAHMSYHFVHGGCGIKPFMDLYILKRQMKHDDNKVRELCRECRLECFYDRVLSLMDIWFCDGEYTDLTKQMEAYVLSGGVYGTTENRVAMMQGQKGGKICYMLSRIFLPYDDLKIAYPILNDKKWLMPFMQVRRWFRIIFGGRFQYSVHELKTNQAISAEKVDRMQNLLHELGLG